MFGKKEEEESDGKEIIIFTKLQSFGQYRPNATTVPVSDSIAMGSHCSVVFGLPPV